VTERSGTSGVDDPWVRVRRLHEHLRATAERPVEPAASRWLGEAEAVAGDLVGAEVDPDVLERRVGHVADLLANVEGTGDAEADDHVATAQEITATLVSER
jgi:hypothetical protein